MTLRLASACSALLVASSSLAHADTGSLRVGADLVTAPAGKLVADLDGFQPGRNADLSPAFGVDLHADYALSPVFRVGLGQRVLYPIELEYGEGDAGFQTDTVLRAVVDAPLRPKLGARVRLSAGYSVISQPDPGDVDGDGDELSSGLILGLAAGAGYQLGSRLTLVGELGYSWGFQGTSIDVPTDDGTTSFDLRLSTNLLHVGIGLELSF